ncbi:hypothetical protein R3P38DRAFT_415084 [Favolaschia claudopus]|uniref:Uncharacterized protein n=1 Tax=Favolaschia claudopus TaxID=2862362 RepID=A0AAV9ZGM9_9AGAR
MLSTQASQKLQFIAPTSKAFKKARRLGARSALPPRTFVVSNRSWIPLALSMVVKSGPTASAVHLSQNLWPVIAPYSNRNTAADFGGLYRIQELLCSIFMLFSSLIISACPAGVARCNEMSCPAGPCRSSWAKTSLFEMSTHATMLETRTAPEWNYTWLTGWTAFPSRNFIKIRNDRRSGTRSGWSIHTRYAGHRCHSVY